jgi:hypothetical protein
LIEPAGHRIDHDEADHSAVQLSDRDRVVRNEFEQPPVAPPVEALGERDLWHRGLPGGHPNVDCSLEVVRMIRAQTNLAFGHR